MKALRKIATDSKQNNKFQEYVAQALQPLMNNELINGILLQNIELKTGSINAVNHKLNRKLIGWVIVRKRSAADVWDSQDSNVLQAQTLNLNCSANVTVDLWVF